MSCHIDDVFHFDGVPQRCLYCLDPLVLAIADVDSSLGVTRCAGCGLQYAVSLLEEAGTEFILTQPDRFHIDRLDIADMSHPGPVPRVIITDLDAARSVLAARGEE